MQIHRESIREMKALGFHVWVYNGFTADILFANHPELYNEYGTAFWNRAKNDLKEKRQGLQLKIQF